MCIRDRPYDHEQYCTIIKDWVMQFARLPYRETLFQSFCEKISYVCMDFTKEEAYDTLAAFYKQHQDTQHIFYFAVAPRFFSTIAQGLSLIHILQCHPDKHTLLPLFYSPLSAVYIIHKFTTDFFFGIPT